MKLNKKSIQILKDIFVIFILAILFGFSYTLIIYKDFNFLERAKNKTINPSSKASTERIKEISIDQALNLIQNQKPLIIDARNESDFLSSKIENAINIPAKNFENYLDLIFTLPRDTLIIIYCEGIHCNLSHQLAEKMLNFGFTNLNIMYEGIEGWQKRNLPLVKNEN